MTAVTIPAYALPTIRPHKWIRNGKYPDAQLAQELADAVNAGARIRAKEHCRFSTSVSPSIAASTVRNRWRCVFRASPFALYLAVGLGIVPGTSAGVVEVTLYDDTLTEVATATATTTVGSGGVAPNNWIDAEPLFVDGAGDLFEPTPYTTYYAVFEDTQCTAIWGTIYEWATLDPDTTNGYVSSNFAATTPVYDADRQGVAVLGRTLWQQQGSHVLNWSTNRDLLPPVGELDPLPERWVEGSYTDSHEKNLVTDVAVYDIINDIWDPDDSYFLLDLSNRARVSESGVTVRIHAYARIYEIGLGFPDLVLRLRDSTGTVLQTLTWPGLSGTSASWKTATVVLPAEAAGYYLTYGIVGSGSYDGKGNVYCVSIFPEDVAE